MFKKQNIGVLIATMMIFSFFLSGCSTSQQETIKVSGAFALYPMMSIWAEEYQNINPNVKIDVSGGGAGKGMTDTIQGLVDMGMISRDIHQSEIDQGIFWVSVAKDAVVATMNSKNPAKDILFEKGVSKEEFVDVFLDRNVKSWGELIEDDNNKDDIRVFTRSDSCGAAQTWAAYLGDYTQDDLTNSADSAINGDPNLAAAVQGDKFGIGYNNINFVYDLTTKKPFENLYPVPIDLNGNGKLDEDENFYSTSDEMTSAIANGIYPSPPARNLHLAFLKDMDEPTKKFIRWILTDGQKYVVDGGYIKLSDDLLNKQINYLETKTRPLK